MIISTASGTINREIKPILSKHIKLAYNPFFIAMGTTIDDFMNPEFVLLGVDDVEAAKEIKVSIKHFTIKKSMNVLLTRLNLLRFRITLLSQ